MHGAPSTKSSYYAYALIITAVGISRVYMTLHVCEHSESHVCSYIWRVLIFFLSVLLLDGGGVLSVRFLLLVLLFSQEMRM